MIIDSKHLSNLELCCSGEKRALSGDHECGAESATRKIAGKCGYVRGGYKGKGACHVVICPMKQLSLTARF